MLVLRLKCEFFDKDLAANCTDDVIFSCVYTFCADCADCADSLLQSDCPNWGRRFCGHLVQPKKAPRESVSLEFQAAFTRRVVTRATQDEIANFSSSYEPIVLASRQLSNR